MPSPPTFIYKLVPSSSPLPDTIPEALPVSDLDLKSGFVHLSTAIQIPGTLKYFFAQEAKVYVLRIPYEPIEKNIKWEDPKAEVCGNRGGEGMFPHLYNGLRLGCNEIESVQVWEKTGDSWDEVLKNAESWLIY
ncbi:hypothetical protein BU17DRAFT_49413 [Hysterangium stoloniferum]|nr:hypothetical protein BU17DRAFT_49413 [Hysterangium stoloniferum]